MSNYLLVNTNTLKSVLVDLDEAARIAELDPDEIKWAIEEVGRCDIIETGNTSWRFKSRN